MRQKSYNNNPKLYLVPTPIGNMEDITIRAINILKESDVVFAEDTRVTGLLLNSLNIKKKLVSNHKFNESKNFEKLEKYYNENKTIVVVSDRGTPGISDPGEVIAHKAIELGYNVISLPGPTALIPAITASGIDASKFLFYGFLNSKQSKRKKEIEGLKQQRVTLIFYEAPHRINDTLKDMYQIFGNRKISVCREISKRYEEIIRINLSEYKTVGEIKGEIVIVVSGNTNEEKEEYKEIDTLELINMFIKDGNSSKEAIKMVAKIKGLEKNEVYKLYHN